MNRIIKIYVGWTLLVGIGVAIGIIGGYYLIPSEGSALSISSLPGDIGMPSELKLTIKPNDVLPSVSIETVDGLEIHLNEIEKGRKIAIIVLAVQCLPCAEFMNQWNQIVTPKLKENTQEVIIVSHESTSDRRKLEIDLEGKKVYHFLRRELESKINAAYFPAAIAVDETGKVIEIQYGLQGGINYNILKFLTTHDI